MESRRMDVYECGNCYPLFTVEVGEDFDHCPYCGENTVEYLNTVEIEVKK